MRDLHLLTVIKVLLCPQSRQVRSDDQNISVSLDLQGPSLIWKLKNSDGYLKPVVWILVRSSLLMDSRNWLQEASRVQIGNQATNTDCHNVITMSFSSNGMMYIMHTLDIIITSLCHHNFSIFISILKSSEQNLISSLLHRCVLLYWGKARGEFTLISLNRNVFLIWNYLNAKRVSFESTLNKKKKEQKELNISF